MKSDKRKKIFVGLSGGVDSSVAAALLVAEGYDVVGVFMQNWSEDLGCCNLERDIADARQVASVLKIPFYVWNFEAEYRERVLDYFFSEYEAGRTPNPDVMCNREVKFKLFLDRALKLGADKVATGHYARLTHDETGHHLLKGIDPGKDQSYFLCALGQGELGKSLFPLGGYTKKQIRQIAKEKGLPTFAKKDSQGICFIGEVDIKEFLQSKIEKNPGKIITPEGKALGRHDGLAFYTLGQRKDIGNIAGGPYYVVDKRPQTNELVVSSNPAEPLLWRSEFIATDLHWISEAPDFPADLEVVIRYHHKPNQGHLEKQGENIKVSLENKERAITPGQFAVFYRGDELLGCGVIDGLL